MVDPLEYLIGFYSVVGRNALTADGSQSVFSQGVVSSGNVRSPGAPSSGISLRNNER